MIEFRAHYESGIDGPEKAVYTWLSARCLEEVGVDKGNNDAGQLLKYHICKKTS